MEATMSEVEHLRLEREGSGSGIMRDLEGCSFRSSVQVKGDESGTVG